MRAAAANHDACAGSLGDPAHREADSGGWPDVEIILRGDSGFCRNELMSWCENNDVDFVFGLARNQRLRRIIGRAMQEATQEHRSTGKPARVFAEFAYRTEEKLGAGAGAWWPKPNTSTAKRIRALW